ncbi:MAG: AMP-binding protein, partial [Bacteroidia bacterium]|nr:AMP-binding protein [Bacteroidia bacterium]
MNKIWLERYPKGIPREINPDSARSITEILEQSVKTYPNLPAYHSMGKEITYAEVDELSKRFACFLQQHTNLKPGDRIAIQMPNCLQYPIALFGALRAGMVVVNTNPLYTPREMEHQFKDSGAKAIVIVENFASNLQEIIKNTQIETVITTGLGDLLGLVKGFIVNLVVKHIKKMVPPYQLPQAISFTDALKKGDITKFKPFNNQPEDLAFLQYTGGTTGISKGAELTHRNIIANIEQISAWMGDLLKPGKEVVITALPMYHIFALTVNTFAFFKIGGKSVLITNPRDLPAFIKELKKHPFTVFTGVNTLFNGLMNRPEFSSINFSTLKVSVGGAMALQQAVVERWNKLTKSPLVEGYGLTEASPLVSCNPLDGTARIGTIGLPVSS